MAQSFKAHFSISFSKKKKVYLTSETDSFISAQEVRSAFASLQRVEENAPVI
ncbi:hypothetical protein BgiMline_017822, partial [Biomphalaria glabrata]